MVTQIQIVDVFRTGDPDSWGETKLPAQRAAESVHFQERFFWQAEQKRLDSAQEQIATWEARATNRVESNIANILGDAAADEVLQALTLRCRRGQEQPAPDASVTEERAVRKWPRRTYGGEKAVAAVMEFEERQGQYLPTNESLLKIVAWDDHYYCYGVYLRDEDKTRVRVKAGALLEEFSDYSRAEWLEHVLRWKSPELLELAKPFLQPDDLFCILTRSKRHSSMRYPERQANHPALFDAAWELFKDVASPEQLRYFIQYYHQDFLVSAYESLKRCGTVRDLVFALQHCRDESAARGLWEVVAPLASATELADVVSGNDGWTPVVPMDIRLEAWGILRQYGTLEAFLQVADGHHQLPGVSQEIAEILWGCSELRSDEAILRVVRHAPDLHQEVLEWAREGADLGEVNKRHKEQFPHDYENNFRYFALGGAHFHIELDAAIVAREQRLPILRALAWHAEDPQIQSEAMRLIGKKADINLRRRVAEKTIKPRVPSVTTN